MLEGLLWTVLGLIGFAVAVLAVPVEVVARLDMGERTDYSLRIGWGKESLIDAPVDELKSLWKNGLTPYY